MTELGGNHCFQVNKIDVWTPHPPSKAISYLHPRTFNRDVVFGIQFWERVNHGWMISKLCHGHFLGNVDTLALVSRSQTASSLHFLHSVCKKWREEAVWLRETTLACTWQRPRDQLRRPEIACPYMAELRHSANLLLIITLSYAPMPSRAMLQLDSRAAVVAAVIILVIWQIQRCSAVERPELLLLEGGSRCGEGFCRGETARLKCIFPKGFQALIWYVSGYKRPFGVEYLSVDLPGHSEELFHNRKYIIVSIFKKESYRANAITAAQ